jgi:hypothetical protein
MWARKNKNRPVSGSFTKIAYFQVMNFIPVKVSTLYFIGKVAAVEISDRKDLNTLYKFQNLISVNRIFIKDYKVSVSI